VLVADVRQGKDRARYVLLDELTRSALSAMSRAAGEHFERDRIGETVAVRTRNPGDSLPETIRTHAFNSAGAPIDPDDDTPLRSRSGHWLNAESLWVCSELAATVIEEFDRWREQNPSHAGAIHAPNWLVLVGCQSLALAAGLPMPQPCGYEPLTKSA
jgi:hypothetical protein